MNGGAVSSAMVGWWQHPLAMEGLMPFGIHAWPLLEHVGWRGYVAEWSRDGGRGWVGFGGTMRAAMGCRAVLNPPVFCESTAFECMYLRCQSFVFDDLWRVRKRILGRV